MAPIRGEKHDVRDPIRVYKYTMGEDEIEFCDTLVRAPTQQSLKIAERVSSYKSGKMDKIARVDERVEEHLKCKAYHRNMCKLLTSISKKSSSKGNKLS